MEVLFFLRWTSQHNCGENNDCQFIIQYACEGQLGENVRDGYPQDINGNTCTQTIPEEPDSEITNPEKYGKNEDYGYYQRCKDRERNHGLFTADQNLRGTSSIYTRQNLMVIDMVLNVLKKEIIILIGEKVIGEI